MKAVFALVLLALFAFAAADVSELGSNFGSGPVGFGPEREYLPPTRSGEAAPAHSFGPDGYRYKSPSRF
ncbi:unnamed protein product [Hermetia illucens]|uniref:Uncharacterized protein n=1 Tax=Hermetia illucens TaxID=343691 RepID=A0A7R8UUE5_HERIL|nr:unnamed protein product [Hermetia illucens]CAD7086789.1 unnamed protein product [Hermetia illucens]